MDKTTTKKPEAKDVKPSKDAPKSKSEIKDTDLDKVSGGRVQIRF